MTPSIPMLVPRLDEAFQLDGGILESKLPSMSLMRELFGPSREEIWRQLADETKANYVEGGFFKLSKVQASHGHWRTTLEIVPIGKRKGTRLRAPYVCSDGFCFKVYRKGIFSDFGKYLGMQDVTVGHSDFDRDFIIKGSDEPKLRRLFNNPRIRELIAAQPRIRFSAGPASTVFTRSIFADKPPDNLYALEFLVIGIIKDKDRLRLLFDLFAETLNELGRMNSASQATPPTT